MSPRRPLALSAEESGALQDVLTTGTIPEKRRARIIQLTAEGLTQIAIAAEVGLSERQVRRWQRAFEAERMGIFAKPAGSPPISPLEVAGEKAAQAPEAMLADVSTEATAAAAPAPEGIAPAAEPEIEGAPSKPDLSQPRLPLKLSKNPGVIPDLLMSEAGRKTLHFHFERMLLHEPGSRLGEDIEAVHDMRVATRRMRSAFVIFGPFYQRKAIKPFLRDLRRTARALGRVRDLDVFREKLGHYEETLPEETRDGLVPLLDDWRARREAARTRLITYLDSPECAAFVEAFAAFLTTEGAGARKADASGPVASYVRYVVPRLVYERYEAVRTYETVIDSAPIEMLHALRIDGKRLRYTLEFFEEVLGPEVKSVIDEVKTLQDHLGDLNDAEVAGNSLRAFISAYEQEQASVRIVERRSIAPIAQYMANRLQEKYHLMVTFPEAWARFNRPEIRRNLALAVSVL